MTDQDWRAEGDANTLAEAKRIEADGVRLARARAAAHKKAMELLAGSGINPASPEDGAAGLKRIP
jgi:hypothetical protein